MKTSVSQEKESAELARQRELELAMQQMEQQQLLARLQNPGFKAMGLHQVRGGLAQSAGWDGRRCRSCFGLCGPRMRQEANAGLPSLNFDPALVLPEIASTAM